jgi:hypothetical protein
MIQIKEIMLKNILYARFIDTLNLYSSIATNLSLPYSDEIYEFTLVPSIPYFDKWR